MTKDANGKVPNLWLLEEPGKIIGLDFDEILQQQQKII